VINLKKRKNILLIIFLLTLFFASNKNTIMYLFDKTSPITSIFTPDNYTNGTLTIIKKVEHPFEENYVIPNNIEFEFEVNLGTYYANQIITTTKGEYTTDENGIIKIKIKPNSNITIQNIDEGTEVIVSEKEDKPGFNPQEENIKKITVSSEEESIIEFINTYNPLSITGENIILKGTKILEGRNWQEGDNFTFKLEYQNEQDEWIELGTKTITYDAKNKEFNKYNFTDIIQSFIFETRKTYKFRLSEVIGNLENIDYDKTINNFEIIIEDKDINGILEIKEIKNYQNITITKEEEKHIIEVIFNNTYKQEEIKIEYNDNKEQSILLGDTILVKDTDYNIETILNNFDGIEGYAYTIYDKNNNEVETTKIRTGDYIKIKVDDKEYTYDLVLSGDVSGDGEITPLDYVKIKNHITGKNKLSDKPYQLAADISDDNEITPLDYVKVKNYITSKGGK